MVKKYPFRRRFKDHGGGIAAHRFADTRTNLMIGMPKPTDAETDAADAIEMLRDVLHLLGPDNAARVLAQMPKHWGPRFVALMQKYHPTSE